MDIKTWRFTSLPNYCTQIRYCTVLFALCLLYSKSVESELLADKSVANHSHFTSHSLCKPLTLQTTHSANLSLCKPLTLQATHFTNHLLCKPLTLQATHFINHSLCKPLTLKKSKLLSDNHEGPRKCRAYRIISFIQNRTQNGRRGYICTHS